MVFAAGIGRRSKQLSTMKMKSLEFLAIEGSQFAGFLFISWEVGSLALCGFWSRSMKRNPRVVRSEKKEDKKYMDLDLKLVLAAIHR
jgi:hypothetical protein